MGKKIDAVQLVDSYIQSKDWRVKENSNSPKCFGGLNKYLAGEVSKNYWLNAVYNLPIKRAYLNGDMHIHDLSGLTLYCCGFSTENILLMGVQGVPNIPVSSPAKHFDAFLNQVANLITIYQNEIMGAVALNSLNVFCAPFIRLDGLDRKAVRQSIQNFIYSINSNSRGGAEPAFTNVTLDLNVAEDLLKKNIIIGGIPQGDVYGAYQDEIDLFNDVFAELMLEGDAEGKPFPYPIITYNIDQSFEWESSKYDKIWEMAGRYGYPYFSNLTNSLLDASDIRSMCCRLQLDLRELRNKNGGLFGAGDSTGSVGVVTVNLPRLAYRAKGRGKKHFFKLLDKVLVLAKDSLELKREFLQKEILSGGLIPAYSKYVGTMDNHFSTIGEVGKNEMCLNFLGVDILDPKGKEFALEVGEYIRTRLKDFQEETGHLYNYEASPAESTAYRLALKDKKKYPEIITAGTEDAPYYTNSCHIPVSKITSIKNTYDHQEALQMQYTGGTVIHNYMDGAISGAQAKHIIKTIIQGYKVPYTSLSPINRYCPVHGYVKERVDNCPHCGVKLKKWQRITGYLREVENFNVGKAQEFKERNQLEVVEDGGNMETN